MAKNKFVVASAVRKFCNARGRRITPQLLHLLDCKIERLLTSACNVHNGGKITIDATVAGHVGITS